MEPGQSGDPADRIEEGDAITLFVYASGLESPVEQEALRQRLAACVAFVRSPDFRARFGARPATLVLRTPAPPPEALAAELLRQGVDVELGPLPGQGEEEVVPPAPCARCGALHGKGSLSLSDQGPLCSGCFQRWEEEQKAALDTHMGGLRRGQTGTSSLVWGGILLALLLLRLCH